MNDPPEFVDATLPPIFKDRGLRVTAVGYYEGKPYILLEARTGRVKRLVIYLQSSEQGHWMYGYEVYDPTTKTKTTYLGDHGDPSLDTPESLEGLPGFGEE